MFWMVKRRAKPVLIMPPKSTGNKRATRKLAIVHSDICGPVNTVTPGDKRYMVTFIDDFSRSFAVFFMAQKFLARATGEAGEKIGFLRTDNGGEYTSNEFKQYLCDNLIGHETTNPHTPDQNGVTERMNRTLLEKARVMIFHAGLPKSYWVEAVNTTVYLSNRIPTQALDGNTSPYELWYSKLPDLSNLNVFGCLGYANVPGQQRTKLGPKAVQLRFIGYSKGTKWYRMMGMNTKQVMLRKDVVFNELAFKPQIAQLPVSWSKVVTIGCDNVPDRREVAEPNRVESMSENEPVVKVNDSQQRPVRAKKILIRLGIENVHHAEVTHSANCATTDVKPQTMRHAMTSPNSTQWKRAAEDEYNSLMEHDTWELTTPPPDRAIVGSRWY